ncbi:hypothetical protein L6259_00970 [Candidatus Parcubacteria bacterium]|nr:hypothetical protein [Patescibacteria group bacterium]MCG2693844.1 hypothetical protein [Candidatus Parcubacteria bacterium]
MFHGLITSLVYIVIVFLLAFFIYRVRYWITRDNELKRRELRSEGDFYITIVFFGISAGDTLQMFREFSWGIFGLSILMASLGVWSLMRAIESRRAYKRLLIKELNKGSESDQPNGVMNS